MDKLFSSLARRLSIVTFLTLVVAVWLVAAALTTNEWVQLAPLLVFCGVALLVLGWAIAVDIWRWVLTGDPLPPKRHGTIWK